MGAFASGNILGLGGNTNYAPILTLGTKAETIAKGQLGAAEGGGTPFQKAMVESYKKGAMTNYDSYAAKFAAAGGGKNAAAADMGALTDEQALALGQQFIDSDFSSGLKALGLAGHNYAEAAGILAGQQQQTMSALGSVAAVIGSIL